MAVVVNFGETLGLPLDYVSHLLLRGDATVHTTIINTRFTGIDDSERLDHNFWIGGTTGLEYISMEPYYGIAIIAFDYEKHGSTLVQAGSHDWPAWTYVTRDVTVLDANFMLVGSMSILHDSGNPAIMGGPEFIYDWGFIENLPEHLAPSSLEETDLNPGERALRIESINTNPFLSKTSIRYVTRRPGRIRISVHDVLGRRLAVLKDRSQQPGSHNLSWDGSGSGVRNLGSGVYFLRLQLGSEVRTRTIVLAR